MPAPPDCCTTYEVDGFRSLIQFSINLRRGLNVLVGPNGSGKTNFVEFLSFLDRLISSGAASAVSTAGGVARVFSHETQTTQAYTLSAKVHGVAQMADPNPERRREHFFAFSYGLALRFNKSASALYIASETIKFHQLAETLESAAQKAAIGTLGVSRSSRTDDFGPKLKISPRLKEVGTANPLSLRPGYLGRRTIESMIEQSGYQSLSPDESLLSSSRSNLPAFDAVKAALVRGRVFNVIPDKVREQEDITRPPGIGSDGAGLASTLFHLQEMSNSRAKRRPLSLRRATPKTFEVVQTWTKLVFREMSTLKIEQDVLTGKYIGLVTVTPLSQSGGELTLPLQSVSDGTLKWLSLISMVLTTPSTFSLEEPENFLHPSMQRYLIELIRENQVPRSGSSHCIVSTHSETVISECAPEELILFRFRSGSTKCSHIRNPERIREEINRSGFGLGHYYASNALS